MTDTPPETDIAEPALLTRMKQRLRYVAREGKLYWKNTGKEAGTVMNNGYRVVGFEGVKYMAHRIIWFFEHKRWPGPHLDHDNHDTDDNRIGNLFDRGVSGNALNRKGPNINNSSGHRGVQALPYGQWQARIQGKYLGTFRTKEMAAAQVERYLNDPTGTLEQRNGYCGTLFA